MSLVTYPFPLADGTQGYLYLPDRLTHEEAERMIAYLKTLVNEPAERPCPNCPAPTTCEPDE